MRRQTNKPTAKHQGLMFPCRHKEYWINYNNLNGKFYIEKEGSYIGSCKGLEDGKRIIDELVD